ncbi:MAG TPA: type IV toxin-antitoxin system AbiEi family antitoxin domain-containing protein [Streptosporangiaceae bacterium]
MDDFNDSLRELIQRQRGVLSRQQLLNAGFSEDLINARLRRGRWRQIHLGIYATFTGEWSREVRMWAAVLRAGVGAALSHHTAAELDRLVKDPAPLIHVTVPTSRRVVAPVPGLIVHRSGRILQARHPSRLPPRTRVEETVLDLVGAARTAGDAFEWLFRACGGRHTTPERIHAAMETRKKLRWRAEITSALGDVGCGVHSGLEHRYLRDVERPHGLPRAIRQARVVRGRRTEYRDVLYEEYLVVVEVDGAAAHPAEDRWLAAHRDNAGAVDGTITLRYSWADIMTRPCEVAAEIGAVLLRRGWLGVLRRCGPACRLGGIPPALSASGRSPAPSGRG